MDALLAGLLGGVGGKSIARLAGEKLADRLMDLIGMQSEEIRLMHELQGSIDQVRMEPFLTACDLIEDARRKWRTDHERLRYLDQARLQLTRAIRLDDDPLRQSLASASLAAVWNLLGHPQDGLIRLHEARRLAIVAVQKMAHVKKPRSTALRRFLIGALPYPYKPWPRRWYIEIEIGNYRLSRYVARKSAEVDEERLRQAHNYAETLRTALDNWPDEAGHLDVYELRLRERDGALYSGPLIPLVAPEGIVNGVGRIHVAAVDLSYEQMGNTEEWKDRRRIEDTSHGWRREQIRGFREVIDEFKDMLVAPSGLVYGAFPARPVLRRNVRRPTSSATFPVVTS